MNSRAYRVRINAGTTLLHQIISTVCGMLIPWIMISTYGSEKYGITISIAQFLSYISLLEGGIGRAARAELYKPLAENNIAVIGQVYHAIKRFFRSVGIMFVLYALLLAVFYYDIADAAAFTREYVFWMVIAIGVGRFSEYMGGITNITLLNADQRQYVVNLVTMATNVLNVLLIFVTVNLGVDIIFVKLISSIVFVSRPVIYTLYVRYHYNPLRSTGERYRLKNRWTGMGQHIAYYIQTNTDVFILTLLADMKIVAIYSVYHLITYSIRTIVLALTGGMEALFGNMIAKEEYDELRHVFERYKLILTVVILVLFGTAGVMILPFVKIYTAGISDANYIQPMFAVVMVLAEAANCLVWPCSTIAISANQLKETRMGSYIEAAINLLSSLLLVFWDPLRGVAIGTLLSVLYKSAFYISYTAQKILKISVWKMIGKQVLPLAVLTGITFVGMNLVGMLGIENYFHWAIISVFVVLLVSAAAGIIGYILYPGNSKELVADLIKKRKRSA